MQGLQNSHWDRCLGMPHTPVPVTAGVLKYNKWFYIFEVLCIFVK